MKYIRRKRGPDGYVEDVNSAFVKWAFQGLMQSVHILTSCDEYVVVGLLAALPHYMIIILLWSCAPCKSHHNLQLEYVIK